VSFASQYLKDSCSSHASTGIVALHFLVHVGYLFEYDPAVRDPVFRQTLRPEHRPFNDSYISGRLVAAERLQHRQQRESFANE
jgi:hypothetical protein